MHEWACVVSSCSAPPTAKNKIFHFTITGKVLFLIEKTSARILCQSTGPAEQKILSGNKTSKQNRQHLLRGKEGIVSKYLDRDVAHGGMENHLRCCIHVRHLPRSSTLLLFLLWISTSGKKKCTWEEKRERLSQNPNPTASSSTKTIVESQPS